MSTSCFRTNSLRGCWRLWLPLNNKFLEIRRLRVALNATCRLVFTWQLVSCCWECVLRHHAISDTLCIVSKEGSTTLKRLFIKHKDQIMTSLLKHWICSDKAITKLLVQAKYDYKHEEGYRRSQQNSSILVALPNMVWSLKLMADTTMLRTLHVNWDISKLIRPLKITSMKKSV
jgi:hypothetical protein